MKVLIVTIAFGLATGTDIFALLNAGKKRDIIVFGLFVLFGYCLAILTVMGIKFPSPAKIIQVIVNQFVKVKFNYQ